MTCELPNQELDAWRSQWGEIGRNEADRPWKLGALFNAGRSFVKDGNNEKTTYRAIWGLVPKLGQCGLDFKSVREMACVEVAFRETRNPNVSYRHHREIWAAGIVGARQQQKWLSKAESRNLSSRELRVALATERGDREREIENPVSFVARRWADQGVNGLRELFPVGKPINQALLSGLRVEVEGLLEEFRRVGLI